MRGYQRSSGSLTVSGSGARSRACSTLTLSISSVTRPRGSQDPRAPWSRVAKSSGLPFTEPGRAAARASGLPSLRRATARRSARATALTRQSRHPRIAQDGRGDLSLLEGAGEAEKTIAVHRDLLDPDPGVGKNGGEHGVLGGARPRQPHRLSSRSASERMLARWLGETTIATGGAAVRPKRRRGGSPPTWP